MIKTRPERPIGKWICSHCGADFKKKVLLEIHFKRQDIGCGAYEIIDRQIAQEVILLEKREKEYAILASRST